MKKSKRIVIDAKLRMESESYPGFLKYELTVKEEDGSVVKIPVYGRDLQHALSRVVVARKVEKVTKKMERIPSWLYLTGFGTYMFVVALMTVKLSSTLIAVIGLIAPMLTALLLNVVTKKGEKLDGEQ